MKKITAIKIGKFTVGKGKPVFIIAEAGVNHNGRLDLALKLIDAAAHAGADAVKFQTFKAEQVVTSDMPMAAYQKKNLGLEEGQLEMVRKLELKEDWYPKLIKRAKERKIMFISAPHGGIPSADFLRSLNIPAYKIASGDLINTPLLRHVAQFKKPMVISTGMATLDEVKEAVREIRNEGNNAIVVLQCTTDYPLSPQDVNLRSMDTIAKATHCLVGYSDHTMGATASIAAVARGAIVIEKHLTLDKKMYGPDHKASLNPEEFKTMITEIRHTETMLGLATKKPTQSEKKLINIVRKSVIALRPIKRGERFTNKNLGVKRPGNGLHPREYFKLIGKAAKRDLAEDELLTKRDL
ncbi:MAG: N-acetylneuraminate synthase [Minisyncoccia bacterium]|jgi:N,N'-diacetyllegionaminate synthase